MGNTADTDSHSTLPDLTQLALCIERLKCINPNHTVQVMRVGIEGWASAGPTALPFD